MSGVTVKLAKPVTAHGEQITELTLREPTVEDIMDLNQPFLIIVGDDETGIRIQGKTIGLYIVRLAGVPMSTVKQITPADFSAAQTVVMSFFGPGAGAATAS